MNDNFAHEKIILEDEHIRQLQTARSQLVISNALEQDYQQLKNDHDMLRMEKDINSNLMRKIEKERDAVIVQAQGE